MKKFISIFILPVAALSPASCAVYTSPITDKPYEPDIATVQTQSNDENTEDAAPQTSQEPDVPAAYGYDEKPELPSADKRPLKKLSIQPRSISEIIM